MSYNPPAPAPAFFRGLRNAFAIMAFVYAVIIVLVVIAS